ncbi:MAG: TetR/AcrR family transcriptional regulator [Acidimicrobiales bacterium]
MSATTPRRKLLQAVVDHALGNGLGDTSLRHLAGAIGTSHRMLIFHFGSRESLLVEVTREVEERQRRLLAELRRASTGDPFEVGRALWEHLCDPALAPQERLFFELYGQALQGRRFAQPLLEGIVEDWLAPVAEMLEAAGAAPATSLADARLMVAVTRGLLLDLLATGDREAVRAAMDRFAEIYARAA